MTSPEVGSAAVAEFDLTTIERCFGGAIPAILGTVAVDGTPNVTYLTKAHRVDDERVALSNQFMSKTSKNLAANPRGSLLLVDPITYDEYRLDLVYERTERRGHVFERLRNDVDAIAAISGMQDVFRLRAADIFRVLDVHAVQHAPSPPLEEGSEPRASSPELESLAALADRLSRSVDLDVLVDTALELVDVELGFHHVHLLLLDESGRRLYTIASRGYVDESIGAEIELGHGLIGTAAERCDPVRVGNLVQMSKYSRSVRREFEDQGEVGPRNEVPAPGIFGAESRLAVPARALGALVGMLVVDRVEPVAFSDADEQIVSIAASMLASAIEHARSIDLDETAPQPVVIAPTRAAAAATATTVRYFGVDGSTFVDGDYLIKGVAGRILWSLLGQHAAEGRIDFTNRELRRDTSLELPEFKDNLESRLVLLKRRLDEHGTPFRIERTGRGRFQLLVDGEVRLDRAD